jgi:LCP family protein required for cell wall assembly
VVLLSAAATATIAFNEVSKLVEALGQNKAVQLSPTTLAPTSRGAPQTILLVGDDRRPPPKRNPNAFVLPHSNEMLLVRIDPSKPTISMLSIPRELQVPIYPPGKATPVVNRINFAYTLGGIQLMTETIKRVLGVQVNHVFVVTFPKFKRAVEEMGCVYMTVDRRYYHVNEPGGEQYFEINLQPGYQRMCGRQALEFVANRHEDTSLTRDARDQRFLLEVKSQFGPTLFENREKFERILGRAVETDLHGTSQVLDLLELLVGSQGKPVRQVPFQVNLGFSVDTASQQQIHESVRGFLSGTAAVRNRSPRPPSAAPHASHHAGHSGSGVVLSPTPPAGLAEARAQAPSLPFAVEYPRARDAAGSGVPDTFRRYFIRDQRGGLHPIYTIVIDRGPLGQFYDVQGTNWANPPLLANPGATIQVGSRTYQLYYAGEQLRVIAWHEGGGVYWIQNTLINSVSPRAMIATADQTVPVVGSVTASAAAANVPVNIPPPPHATTKTGLATKIGALFGFIGLAVVGGLGLLVLRRQRELTGLREQVGRAMALEALQRPAVAAAGPAAGGGGASSGVAPAGERPPPRTAAAPREAPPSQVAAESKRTIYRSGISARRVVLAAIAATVVIGLIAFGVQRLTSGAPHNGPTGAAIVPVAVFNASGSAAAAHHVAHLLRPAGVRIAAVGGLNAGLGRGAFVLYPPGARAEATRVAGLLASLSPTVAPMPQQVSSAVAGRDEIVVVLD